jgi:hypothetical protein
MFIIIIIIFIISRGDRTIIGDQGPEYGLHFFIVHNIIFIYQLDITPQTNKHIRHRIVRAVRRVGKEIIM